MNIKWQEQLERHRSQRREDIIKAAERLFLEKGLASVTIKDIVGFCGISKVTLYKYFESFDEIIIEVQMSVLQRYWMDVEAVTPEGNNGLDKLRAVLERVVRVSQAQSDSIQFIAMFDAYYRIQYPTEVLEQRYRSFLRSDVHPIAIYLKEGIEDGSIRSDIDIQVMTYTISNVVNATLQRMIGRGTLLQRDQGVNPDLVLGHTISMVMSYIKSE